MTRTDGRSIIRNASAPSMAGFARILPESAKSDSARRSALTIAKISRKGGEENLFRQNGQKRGRKIGDIAEVTARERAYLQLQG